VSDRTHEQQVCVFAGQKLADRRGGGKFQVDRYPDEEERSAEDPST
jgi:hypothetical protein